MALQDDLKSREIEVLRLMAEGLTNREIADRLYIGVETVRWYAQQIYSKFDVSGREEATAKAASLGLLDAKTEQSGKAPRTKPKHNLPTQLTSFIGREKPITEVTDLLSETRLLTLTGPGGTGKTRLALKVAEGLLDTFADGVCFVDLAPISDPEMVPSAIARALDIIESGDQPLMDALKRALGQRAMLLVLDNYEHLIRAASVVTELLAAAPNIKIMVTSQEDLRLKGEHVYTVPPMRLPDRTTDDLDALEATESVALFVQQAQAVKTSFRLKSSEIEDIVAICRRLDGMPLAIELAAGQSRFLTPDAILKRLENRFQSLTGGARDAPSRQQTLRNALDWSYMLLTAGEKTLFARLSVFRGGRSLEAIEKVCGEDLPIDVFDGLASLVDKSMIRQVEDKLDEPRFVMLETIQEYAWERLEESGKAEAMRRRHAEYFADLTAYAQPFLRKKGFEYWFPRLTIEQDNIRAALGWSLFGGDAETGLRMVDALRDFWFYEGYHIEGQRWAEQALEHLDDVEPLLQARVLHTAALLADGQQNLQQCILWQKQGLAIAQELGNELEIAWGLIVLATSTYDASARTQQDYEAAVAMCEESLSIFRKLEDKAGLAMALNSLSNIHLNQGHYLLAREASEACLGICRETGERRREAIMLGNLSDVAAGLGNYREAERLARDGLRLLWDLDFTYVTVLELGQPRLPPSITKNHAQRAARLLGASAALQEAMNIRHQPNQMPHVSQIEANARRQLGEAAFQAAWDEGRKMSLEDAVAYALEDLGDD